MNVSLLDIIRLLVLAMFCISSVSPLCVSGHLDDRPILSNRNDENSKVTIGIVWLRIVLSALTDRALADNCGDGIPDGTTVLIKKARAVCREYSGVRPYQEAKIMPPARSEADLFIFMELTHTSYQHPHLVNGYRYSSTGLSPPSHLS